jgi:hypothetical protein
VPSRYAQPVLAASCDSAIAAYSFASHKSNIYMAHDTDQAIPLVCSAVQPWVSGRPTERLDNSAVYAVELEKLILLEWT